MKEARDFDRGWNVYETARTEGALSMMEVFEEGAACFSEDEARRRAFLGALPIVLMGLGRTIVCAAFEKVTEATALVAADAVKTLERSAALTIELANLAHEVATNDGSLQSPKSPPFKNPKTRAGRLTLGAASLFVTKAARVVCVVDK